MGFLDQDLLLVTRLLTLESLVHGLSALFCLHQTLHCDLLRRLGLGELALGFPEGGAERFVKTLPLSEPSGRAPGRHFLPGLLGRLGLLEPDVFQPIQCLLPG